MSRILVDLTEFRGWSGHLTGVQRVVSGLATNLESDTEIIFYSYDDVSGRLVRDDIKNYASQPELQADMASVPGNSAKERAVRLAKQLYFKTPLAVRQRITVEQKRKLKAAGKKAFHIAAKTKRSLQRQVPVQVLTDNRPEVTIESGDTLVIAGRLWDHPEYQQFLIGQKNRVNFRLAIVIYDLIPIYQQHTFGAGLTEPYAQYLFNALTYADLLLPISKSSAKDLARFADENGFIEVPKVQVIRLGDDIDTQAPARKPAWVKEEQFTICVGTIEARKNHALLYAAYKLAHQQNIELPHLYIVGKPGWLTSDTIYFIEHDLDVKDKISIQSSVRDDELAWLYQNAVFTVYPSQYEGWGLPIAESLLYGVPCIASNTSSMIEIAPKLVDHISPFDAAELVAKVMQLSDPDYNSRRRAEIKRGYEPTRWSDTTGSIIKLID